MRIPPGNPREDPSVPFHLKGIDAPAMKYCQGPKRTCASDSLANALYYLDYPRLAEQIHSIGVHMNQVDGENADIFAMCKNCMRQKPTKKLMVLT